MIVDIYTHILPKALLDELGRSGARFRQMDEVGADYRQIVSLPNPPVEAFATEEQAPTIARLANDAMAELVARHPDRFPAFVAALPFHDMAATLAEAERAIRDL